MSKKLKLPAILMAHDLLEGHVIYWTSQGWSKNAQSLVVANDEEKANELEVIAKKESDKNIVVDAVLSEVTIDGDNIKPRHFRELVKLNGPSVPYGVVF